MARPLVPTVATLSTPASMSAILRRPGLAPVLAGLMLSMFLAALDGTVVGTAMPSIIGTLGGFSLYAWVPAIYLLVSSVSTPLYGKLADLYGRKSVLFAGVSLFLIGSILCGVATSMPLLIAFRAVQGLGAGAVVPITLTIIGDLFSLEERARIQGVFSSVWGISSLIGPPIGGFLVESLSWRWVFFINLPIGALALFLLVQFFEEKKRPSARTHRVDVLGASLLSGGLTTLLLVLIEGNQAWPWVSAPTAVLSVAGICLLWAFVWQEGRVADPIIAFPVLRQRLIAIAVLSGIFTGVLMTGIGYYVPLFVQGVQHGTAIQSGTTLAPMLLGWPLAGSIAGRLALRYGYRNVSVVGMLWCLAGCLCLLLIIPSTPLPFISAFSFMTGVGLGLVSLPMLVAAQNAVQWAQRGLVTSAVMFMRSFGQVVGLAIMGAAANSAFSTLTTNQRAIINASLDPQRRSTVTHAASAIALALQQGIHSAFVVGALAAVAGVGLVLMMPRGVARAHMADLPAGAPPTH